MPFSLRVLVVTLVMLAIAAPARAQDAAPAVAVASVEPARLEYTAAPGCFDADTFHHAVASYMDKGRDPFDASSPVVLRVTFKKVRGGYRGSIQKIPAAGEPWPEEDWTGPTCADVFREIARLASVRVLGPPKPAPAPPAPAPPDPVTSQAPRVAPAPFDKLRFTPPPPPRMDIAITLSTSLLLTAGFTANAGLALQIGGGFRYDWFSLDLEVRGVFPGIVWARDPIPLEDRLKDNASDPLDPQYFDLSQLSVQLVPCGRFATYFALCAVGGAYALITQDYSGTASFPGWIIGPRFRVEVPFAERFAVFGFAEALFAPLGALQGYRDPSAPGQHDAPNVKWDLSIVSGFFGVGALVKFQ